MAGQVQACCLYHAALLGGLAWHVPEYLFDSRARHIWATSNVRLCGVLDYVCKFPRWFDGPSLPREWE